MPQIVPVQLVEGTGPPVSPPEPCVVASVADPGPSVAPPAFPPWQISTPLKVMEENEGSVFPEKLSWKPCSRYSPAFFPEKYEGLWRVKLFPDPVSWPSQKVRLETGRSVVKLMLYWDTSAVRRIFSLP